MTFITSVLLALLPVLASAQSAPQNVTSFGGYPSNEYALQYYRASHSSNVTNAVNFPGYNWSSSIGSSSVTGATNSSEPWQMHLNYSTVVVPTSTGNVTTGNTVLSMTFSDEQWALDSDWQLCASLALDALPDSIASKSANNSDSSCAPYLGQSCINALTKAYRSQPFIAGCPVLPSLSSIDECKSVANSNSGGVGTAAITNTTSPDLIYESSQYISVSGTGPTYSRSNVTRQGLSSGQAFASFLSVFANTNTAALSVVESKKLRLVGLSIVPSAAFRANSSGGYGWEPNTRLICARANANTSATSGASGSAQVPLAAFAAGIMVTLLMRLW